MYALGSLNILMQKKLKMSVHGTPPIRLRLTALYKCALID